MINYTIVATNDGNATLAAVTVSDPFVSGLSCTPANGSALAPGASMNCTATHTVTQADIDARHYANTACVDDGTSGAAQACATKDVPAPRHPSLTITKVATPGRLQCGRRGDQLHDRGDQQRQHDAGGGDGERPEGERPGLHADERFVAGAWRVDDLHGDAHGDAGGHRCRALRQHGLCRRWDRRCCSGLRE